MAAVATEAESKSDACVDAGPAKQSNQYVPKGVIKTMKARKDSQSKLSDIEVYYSSDIDIKQEIKNVVLVLYDIFGWNDKNKNVFEFVDKLATKGNGSYYVIMPDHYRGNPYPVDKEIKMEDIMAWKQKTATYDIVEDDMTERILPQLRQENIEQICFVGLCWGGTVGFKLGECNIANTKDMFVGLVSIHGSRINDDLCNNIEIPVCYCPTPKDQPIKPVKEILDKKQFAAKCVYKCYDNMGHGFTAGRGDYDNKEILDAVNDVINLSTDFFKNVFKIDADDKKINDDNMEILGGWKEAETKECQDAANAVKSDVEKQADIDKQDKISCYEVVNGTKQVVAGLNYKIKLKIGDNRYCQIMVYRSLPPIKYELKTVEW